MTIQHIGTRAITLYLSERELTERNLHPAAIGRTEALELLALALEERRLADWEAAELEVYAGANAVLLFIRRKSGSPRHFYFADFEALIIAAHLCQDVLSSALFRVAGGYVLTVYPFEGDPPPSVFSEYGEDWGGSVYLLAHLIEQETALIPTGALASLRTHFAVKTQ